jgi:hypothetical protein
VLEHLIALLLLAVCACGVDQGEATVESRAESIVYGDDDRRDLFETDEPFALIAERTAVALLSPSQLRQLPSGDYAIDAQPYGELQMLCPGERFAEQPAAASCSGVLLAPDIVATAGHCLTVRPDSSPDCTNNRYVFGFGVRDPNTPITIGADDVFDCKRVLGRVRTPAQVACRYDFVLLELDHAVPQASVAVPRAHPVQQDEAVAVIGFPAGLPVKIDRGARVVDARSAQGDYFTLDSDTFAVSSGSGVFDSKGQLVGLFARGRRDYDQEGSCQRVHRESQTSAAGYEEATNIEAVSAVLLAVTHGRRLESSGGSSCAAADYADINAAAVPASSGSGCVVAAVGVPSSGELASSFF